MIFMLILPRPHTHSLIFRSTGLVGAHTGIDAQTCPIASFVWRLQYYVLLTVWHVLSMAHELGIDPGPMDRRAA